MLFICPEAEPGPGGWAAPESRPGPGLLTLSPSPRRRAHEFQVDPRAESLGRPLCWGVGSRCRRPGEA